MFSHRQDEQNPLTLYWAQFVAMLTAMMIGIVARRVLLALVVGALSHPQAAHARVKQHDTTSAHAPLHSIPSHHPAHPTAQRSIIAHARPDETRHAVAGRARRVNGSAGRPLIVIDPGHGGRDPGAIGALGTPEKSVNLATARELRRLLEATGRYRVALTRTGDQTVSLASRLAFARGHNADLLIAIHADASRDHQARGASVYVRSGSNPTAQLPANRGNSGRIALALSAPEPRLEPGSAWLQDSMIEQLADDVRMVATPARAAHLYVLGSRTVPSVLLEMGFLSNRGDEALLKQLAHRRVVIQAIRDAIDDYFAAIRTHASPT